MLVQISGLALAWAWGIRALEISGFKTRNPEFIDFLRIPIRLGQKPMRISVILRTGVYEEPFLYCEALPSAQDAARPTFLICKTP